MRGHEHTTLQLWYSWVSSENQRQIESPKMSRNQDALLEHFCTKIWERRMLLPCLEVGDNSSG